MWERWAIEWRDVVILDDSNHVAGIYNLNDHNLLVPADYQTLKNMLISAATAAD